MDKHYINRSPVKALLAGVVCLAFQAIVTQSEAQTYTLTDNNSRVQIDVGTQTGMYTWSVDGQDQLYQQWFWYRVGTNAEQAISTISAPTVTTNDARTLYTSYNNGQYGVEVDYMLTGFSAGSGISDIGESIRITNCTSAPLEFHFFQYSDFNLGGTPGGDVVQLGKNIQGQFNEAFQQKGTTVLTETVATPGANHGEVAFWAQTLNELNDAVPTTLNDNAGPLGTGDVTWALQWDLTVAAGSSVGISKDKYLVIPEPGMLLPYGLILLGAFHWLLRRRF